MWRHWGGNRDASPDGSSTSTDSSLSSSDSSSSRSFQNKNPGFKDVSIMDGGGGRGCKVTRDEKSGVSENLLKERIVQATQGQSYRARSIMYVAQKGTQREGGNVREEGGGPGVMHCECHRTRKFMFMARSRGGTRDKAGY
jgi:hypothetical protein